MQCDWKPAVGYKKDSSPVVSKMLATPKWQRKWGRDDDDVFLSRSLATSTTSRSITARAVKKTGNESRTKSSNY